MDTNGYRSTWWGMILGSIIRHGITSIGAVLLAHGWLDEKAHGVLTQPTTEDAIIGGALLLLVFAWSAASKTKALQWVRTALHLDMRASLSEVKREAAKVKPAAKVPLVIAAAFLSAALMLPLTSCKSSAAAFDSWHTKASQIVNADDASRYYVMSSDVYSTLMRALVDLRGQHRIDDKTWHEVEKYRDGIGIRGQQLGVLLKLWRMEGKKPAEFDAAFDDAINQIQALQDVYGGLR